MLLLVVVGWLNIGFFIFFCRNWNIMKSIGMVNMLNIVFMSILFIVFVLIEELLMVFVFLENISGSKLRIKVKEVMRIGCRCVFVFLMVVFIIDKFCFFCCMVNFMIRMVFFVSKLMSMMSVICR